MLKRSLSAVVLTLLLFASGCGFQLRGVADIPAELRTLYLTGDSRSELYKDLAQIFETSGVDLVAEPSLAPYRIELLNHRTERRSASLSGEAKTEEYELRLTLDYQILDREGEVVVEPLQIFTERVYRYDEDSANAKQAEEELLQREMRASLAAQVVRRYLTLAGSQQQAQ